METENVRNLKSNLGGNLTRYCPDYIQIPDKIITQNQT